MNLSIIACIGKNLELGKDNNLIWHLPNDLRYFKAVTTGHVVVMGRNTYKSLSKPLKDRKNVVLSSHDLKDVEVYHSIEEFIEAYKEHKEEIFIIGGASIYKQFLPYADTLYLTEVDKESEADVYFPEFDKGEFEREVIKEETHNEIHYSYVIYRRRYEKIIK